MVYFDSYFSQLKYAKTHYNVKIHFKIINISYSNLCIKMYFFTVSLIIELEQCFPFPSFCNASFIL